MRFFLIAALSVLVVLLPYSPSSAGDIYNAIGSSPTGESMLTMDYHWVYGITEKVEILGDGRIRVERHVHDQPLFDGLRAHLNSIGELSPYQQSMYKMEEGDYDSYWVLYAGSKAFTDLVRILKDAGYPNIDETYGDWEVWAISLDASGISTRVGEVIRDADPGFEKALSTIEDLINAAKSTDPVSKDDYDGWLEPLDGPSLGGVS